MTRRSKSCKDTFVPFPEKIAHFDAGIGCQDVVGK